MMNQEGEQETATPAGKVLEFDLGSEAYCVDIRYVAEIARPIEVRSAPDSPEHVTGVLDLRGTTITIVDPRELLQVETNAEANRVVVFEPSLFDDNEPVGWLVDRTQQVTLVSADEIKESSAYDEFVKGIVERDGGSIVWIDPLALHG